MSDNKIASIGKGVLYIVALSVCAIALIVCLSNEAIFVHIPVSGSIREMGSAVFENGYFSLSILYFMGFACPGWLLSQLIFKGYNEVWSFAVYTSALLLITIVLSFIGYLVFDDGFIFSLKGMCKELIEMSVLIEVIVIVVVALIGVLLRKFRKKVVNIVIGSLFVISYFCLAVSIATIE